MNTPNKSTSFVGLVSGLFALMASGLKPGKLSRIRLARKKSDNPDVYVESIDANLTDGMLREHNMKLSTSTVLDEGYTEISCVGRDRKTGLRLIIADVDARTNPNFKAFAKKFLDVAFDQDGTVIGAKQGTCASSFAYTKNRAIFALHDANFVELKTPAKQVQYFMTTGVLGFIEVGNTEVVALRTEKIVEKIDRNYAVDGVLMGLSWRVIDTLAYPALAISRDDFGGKVIITTRVNETEHNLEPFSIELTEENFISMKSVSGVAITTKATDRRLIGRAADDRNYVYERGNGAGTAEIGTEDDNPRVDTFLQAAWARSTAMPAQQ